METEVMFNQPVVIDNGSGIIKAGFAGDEVPKCIFGNYVGRPKHVRVMAGGLQQDHFTGALAEEHRGLLSKWQLSIQLEMWLLQCILRLQLTFGIVQSLAIKIFL